MPALALPVDFALEEALLEAKEDRRRDSDEDTLCPSGSTSPTTKLLEYEDSDVEAQTQHGSATNDRVPVEYTVALSTKLFFLGLYFLLNLGVTLGNKALLKIVSLPWMLTFCHTSVTAIGSSILLVCGRLELTQLRVRENLILVAFSTLFTLNIAISNVSLALVSVPFHQVMRSSGPILTICICRFALKRTYAMETYLSLLPLFVGVGLATFGDYSFSVVGFTLTFLGVLLASIKTVATNLLMTGTLKMSPMELLLRMSPLAALQCLLYALVSGELSAIRVVVGEGLFTWPLVVGIAGNATMAFTLNIVSFQTNKIAGPLTISVCGNIKQCLTILLGIVLFNVQISWLNGVGMFVAVCGGAYYSKVEVDRTKDNSNS